MEAQHEAERLQHGAIECVDLDGWWMVDGGASECGGMLEWSAGMLEWSALQCGRIGPQQWMDVWHAEVQGSMCHAILARNGF